MPIFLPQEVSVFPNSKQAMPFTTNFITVALKINNYPRQ